MIAVDHVLYAVSTRSWKNLNPLGIVLTLSLWLEVGLAGGRFAGLWR
jgi:hypothetical protein